VHFACCTVVHQLVKESIWNASAVLTACRLLATLIARTCEAILPDLLRNVMTYSSTTVTHSMTANKLLQSNAVKIHVVKFSLSCYNTVIAVAIQWNAKLHCVSKKFLPFNCL